MVLENNWQRVRCGTAEIEMKKDFYKSVNSTRVNDSMDTLQNHRFPYHVLILYRDLVVRFL